MDELLPLAIGIGLAVSLLFSELFGLAAGGMVVPGYIALALPNPIAVVLTVGAGFATYAIVHALATIAIVYGRRRTVLMIVVGYLVGALVRLLAGEAMDNPTLAETEGYTVVGYIIPGLIAIWYDRQGIIATTATLLTASVVVRLTLVLLIGSELLA
jgi:poly-gamma-glutamate biosynthesis protein PgsC/CapC